MQPALKRPRIAQPCASVVNAVGPLPTRAGRPVPFPLGAQAPLAPASSSAAPLRTSAPSQRAATTCGSASAAAAIAAEPSLTTLAVTVATGYYAVAYAMMVLLGRWHRVRQLLSTPWTLAPLALAYAVLLADSWAPDTLRTMMPGSLQAGLSGGFNPQFMPQLGSIMQLLGRPVVAASAWLHLLVINFVAGRFIFWQGVFQGVPTLHSLLVTCVFAPAGLLLHLLTKVLFAVVTGGRSSTKTLSLDGGGRIIIEPYEM